LSAPFDLKRLILCLMMMKDVLNMKILYFLLVSVALFLTSCDNNDGVSFDAAEQFKADVKAIDDYLTATSTDAIKDQSGVRIVLTSVGIKGLPPKRDHNVKVKYTGSLLKNGAVFDDGTVEGVLSGMLPGWIESFEILPEGSVATLYVPSGLGFGNTDRSGVPPNSILVYDVELVDVTVSDTEMQQFQADTAAINKYLKDNSINAFSTPFGVKYTITELGNGLIPGWYSKVAVTYRSRLLNSTSAFFNGTVQPNETFDSRVVDFLLGLQVAFQSFPAGTKAVVYIPSTLAFGKDGAGEGTVPANANVVYEINSFELVNF
jgi:FKBP-type peptidyl-prolyl cis-trans isomerase FkpA